MSKNGEPGFPPPGISASGNEGEPKELRRGALYERDGDVYLVVQRLPDGEVRILKEKDVIGQHEYDGPSTLKEFREDDIHKFAMAYRPGASYSGETLSMDYFTKGASYIGSLPDPAINSRAEFPDYPSGTTGILSEGGERIMLLGSPYFDTSYDKWMASVKNSDESRQHRFIEDFKPDSEKPLIVEKPLVLPKIPKVAEEIPLIVEKPIIAEEVPLILSTTPEAVDTSVEKEPKPIGFIDEDRIYRLADPSELPKKLGFMTYNTEKGKGDILMIRAQTDPADSGTPDWVALDAIVFVDETERAKYEKYRGLGYVKVNDNNDIISDDEANQRMGPIVLSPEALAAAEAYKKEVEEADALRTRLLDVKGNDESREIDTAGYYKRTTTQMIISAKGRMEHMKTQSATLPPSLKAEFNGEFVQMQTGLSRIIALDAELQRLIDSKGANTEINHDAYLNEIELFVLSEDRLIGILKKGTVDSDLNTDSTPPLPESIPQPPVDPLWHHGPPGLHDDPTFDSLKETKEGLNRSVEELQALRIDQREANVEEFAAKYNITLQYVELRAIERQVADVIRKRGTNVVRVPFNTFKLPKELQEDYTAAQAAWIAALDGAVPKFDTPTKELTKEQYQALSPEERAQRQDRIKAEMIAKRDTVIRPGKLKTEALRAGLDERSQKLAVRLMQWASFGATELLREDAAVFKAGFKGYSKLAEKVGGLGEGAARGAMAGYELFGGQEISEERKAAVSLRARRIVGSAAIWSLLVPVGVAAAGTAGIAAAAGLGTLSLTGMSAAAFARILRGGIGIATGGVAGVGAGKAYERTIGTYAQKKNETSRQNLTELYKKGSLTDLLETAKRTEAEKIYQRGNTEAREARTQRAASGRSLFEMGVAGIVGGLAAYESSGVINKDMFGSHSAVDKAVGDIRRTETGSATASSEAAPAPKPTTDSLVRPRTEAVSSSANPPEQAATSAAPTPAAPEGVTSNVSIENASGEGTDQLFRELKAVAGKPGFGGGTHSAALNHLLGTNSNALSREMGEAYGTRGMVTHVGDKFIIDSKQNVYFQAAGGEPQLFLENNDASPKGFTVHEIDAKPLPPIEQQQAARTTPARAPQPIERPAAPAETQQSPSTTAPQEISNAPAPSPEAVVQDSVTPAASVDAVNAVPDQHADTSVVDATTPADAIDASNASTAPAISPDQAPAATEPLAAERPAVPASSEAVTTPAADHSAPEAPASTSSALEPYTNPHGEFIDPSKPGMHPWRVPGTKLTYPVIYGGDDATRAAWADQYLKDNPGTEQVLTTYTDPLTHQTYLQLHKLGPTGQPQPPIGMVYFPDTEEALPIPDPKDFLKMRYNI